MDVGQNPSFDEVARDLQALKARLADLHATDLPVTQAEAMATEISAIRLQLKRLAADREAVAAAIARALETPQR